MKMDDLKIGYLAGIIDGEGCVYVNRRKSGGKDRRKTPGYSVKVVVSTTSESLVVWLKKHARLTSVFHNPKPGENRKPKWVCTWNNSAAEWLLTLVSPCLVIKSKQAELGLELLKHLRESKLPLGKPVPQEIVSYRERIKIQIAALNFRGILP